MPIEIKELHIRINVDEPSGQTAGEGEISEEQKDEIIEECVEQVMEILSLKEER
jgi:phenylpyruvate tautomerase PptA (4-oxalocrotonate tautomerase family)